MKQTTTLFGLPGCLAISLVALAGAESVEVNGARIEFFQYAGTARLTAQADARFKLRIGVEPGKEQRPLTIHVQLPGTGPSTWPAADVVVTDSRGKRLLVRRTGLEWHRLLFEVPATRAQYVVQTVRPKTPGPPRLEDRVRMATDSLTGLRARICRWYDGRRAALCIRFDDSHPTHLSRAIPILREYGFKGTFMINPGRPGFLEHKGEWEAVARRGDQEFGNHTMHHRGARGDEDAEHEIGDAATYIQSLFPNKSKLIALNLGGGTVWETTRPMRYFLDKYHLFDAASGSLGMDDTYGNRVEAFRRNLERHLARGGWCRVHYHYIGKGLSTSEENFRAELNIAKQHTSDLWITGLADAYKYRWERWAARLALKGESPARAQLILTFGTNPELYDQPLTIEVMLPPSWPTKQTRVKHAGTNRLAFRPASVNGRTVIRLDVAPIDGTYVIERAQ